MPRENPNPQHSVDRINVENPALLRILQEDSSPWPVHQEGASGDHSSVVKVESGLKTSPCGELNRQDQINKTTEVEGDRFQVQEQQTVFPKTSVSKGGFSDQKSPPIESGHPESLLNEEVEKYLDVNGNNESSRDRNQTVYHPSQANTQNINLSNQDYDQQKGEGAIQDSLTPNPPKEQKSANISDPQRRMYNPENMEDPSIVSRVYVEDPVFSQEDEEKYRFIGEEPDQYDEGQERALQAAASSRPGMVPADQDYTEDPGEPAYNVPKWGTQYETGDNDSQRYEDRDAPGARLSSADQKYRAQFVVRSANAKSHVSPPSSENRSQSSGDTAKEHEVLEREREYQDILHQRLSDNAKHDADSSIPQLDLRELSDDAIHANGRDLELSEGMDLRDSLDDGVTARMVAQGNPNQNPFVLNPGVNGGGAQPGGPDNIEIMQHLIALQQQLNQQAQLQNQALIQQQTLAQLNHSQQQAYIQYANQQQQEPEPQYGYEQQQNQQYQQNPENYTDFRSPHSHRGADPPYPYTQPQQQNDQLGGQYPTQMGDGVNEPMDVSDPGVDPNSYQMINDSLEGSFSNQQQQGDVSMMQQAGPGMLSPRKPALDFVEQNKKQLGRPPPAKQKSYGKMYTKKKKVPTATLR